MSKIKEIIVEPSRIVCGSTFKLKIKAIKYLTYGELKTTQVKNLKRHTVLDLKGGRNETNKVQYSDL